MVKCVRSGINSLASIGRGFREGVSVGGQETDSAAVMFVFHRRSYASGRGGCCSAGASGVSTAKRGGGYMNQSPAEDLSIKDGSLASEAFRCIIGG